MIHTVKDTTGRWELMILLHPPLFPTEKPKQNTTLICLINVVVFEGFEAESLFDNVPFVLGTFEEFFLVDHFNVEGLGFF